MTGIFHNQSKSVGLSTVNGKECAAAFVFFKTRHAAIVAAQVLQSSNPMLWVTDLAPEPHDVYWSNLCIPYRQLWIRKIGTLVAAVAFMLVFLIPVTFVQGLTQLDQLQQTFPFLRGLLKNQLNVFSSVKDIPAQLAKAVPRQVTFFTTYVLTSGWASLACEVMQIFALLCNLSKRFILRIKDDSSSDTFSFPYHTEVPRLLLFGFLGFTCSILAPLILPFLLLYFVLAYLVYRNQILNVYVSKYETGGQFWPIVHNTTIFSLVLSQIIALGVFGIKRSPVASGFTIPLIICTLLFNEYCRQRFLPIFKNNAAEILIDMDRKDEQSGMMEELHQQLHSAYCQFTVTSHELCRSECFSHLGDRESSPDPKNVKSGNESSVNGSDIAHCNLDMSEASTK
uniref:CSC1/OSCA1-like 7TM region domain-containing protein n=1 Tax=Fagus sylvatica TaxID=28930 RepID=A0A2N9F2E3_FAGSY